MRLYIWEELFWNHTSGTVYATLHLGRGLERNNTSGTNFIRYSLGRGLEKEQHIWERFYPLQYELTSGRKSKKEPHIWVFPFAENPVNILFTGLSEGQGKARGNRRKSSSFLYNTFALSHSRAVVLFLPTALLCVRSTRSARLALERAFIRSEI